MTSIRGVLPVSAHGRGAPAGLVVTLVPLLSCLVGASAAGGAPPEARRVELGARPRALVEDMDEGWLTAKLQECPVEGVQPSDLSIGHRGAPLAYPEHTRESYEAAARQGAGVVECDVTFTSDLQLVCRHSQCDLHTTTNMLATPLAAKCARPFEPAVLGEDGGVVSPASARCCTSDITLEEFKSLRGRRDVSNPAARTVEEYLSPASGDAARPRGLSPGEIVEDGTLVTHAESIALFQSLGVEMTPELKDPLVEMPFEGLTQEGFARKLIDEYRSAGVPPDRVWPQSFSLDDVLFWIESEPAFGRQALYLDGRGSGPDFDPADPGTWTPSMEELKQMGVNVIAPPLWMLLAQEDGRIVPSAYARRARKAGLDIVAWTLERSGSLEDGGGWYYQTVNELVDGDGDVFEVLDVLVRQVGVIGVFSDWPATVTWYSHCIGRSQDPLDEPEEPERGNQ